jgi:hypothetical protein
MMIAKISFAVMSKEHWSPSDRKIENFQSLPSDIISFTRLAMHSLGNYNCCSAGFLYLTGNSASERLDLVDFRIAIWIFLIVFFLLQTVYDFVITISDQTARFFEDIIDDLICVLLICGYFKKPFTP